MAIVNVRAGSVIAADPWDLDFGTGTTFTAGNRAVFFYGAHGTGPAITTIEFEVAGTPTGVFMTKLDDVSFGGTSYWEVWIGEFPSTSNLYDLLIDSAGTPISGGGYAFFELDDITTGLGPVNTWSYTGAVTALPAVTTNRAALLITGSHGTNNYSNLSTVDDSFTVATATASRQFIAYRYAATGVTTAADVDWAGSSETGDAIMFAVYLVPATITGTSIFGEDGTVAGLSRVHLLNLDGVTRTVSDEDFEGSAVLGGNLSLIEQAGPPNAVANTARIWAEDNGSGKTRLMVQFGSGSAVQIAIEP
jgi:hypothetical protein